MKQSFTLTTKKAGRLIGIYAIRHVASGKTYIGSSSNIASRWRQHKSGLNLKKHGNPKLQLAWNKYGASAFEFVVLEVIFDESELLLAEQRAFDAHKPEFNICRQPERNRAGVMHTPQAIQRMSEAHKGKTISQEHREKLAAAFKGRQFSQETRRKISESKRGKKRPPPTEQARANLSAGAKGKVLSKETREKLSKKHKGKVMSPESRLKMSASQRIRFARERNEQRQLPFNW